MATRLGWCWKFGLILVHKSPQVPSLFLLHISPATLTRQKIQRPQQIVTPQSWRESESFQPDLHEQARMLARNAIPPQIKGPKRQLQQSHQHLKSRPQNLYHEKLSKASLYLLSKNLKIICCPASGSQSRSRGFYKNRCGDRDSNGSARVYSRNIGRSLPRRREQMCQWITQEKIR